MTQSGNQVTKFETILSQDGQTVSMGSDCGYTAGMSCDLAKGMAFALSNWGGDVQWLSKNKCGGSNYNQNALTFSNIEITTGSGSADGCQSGGGGGGGGDTGNYTYGDACAHADDDDCGSSCSYGQCKWSWPSDDPAAWASSNAKCRCQH